MEVWPSFPNWAASGPHGVFCEAFCGLFLFLATATHLYEVFFSGNHDDVQRDLRLQATCCARQPRQVVRAAATGQGVRTWFPSRGRIRGGLPFVTPTQGERECL